MKTLHVRTVSLVSLCSIHEDINCNDIILVLWIYVLFSPLRLSDQFVAAFSRDNRPSWNKRLETFTLWIHIIRDRSRGVHESSHQFRVLLLGQGMNSGLCCITCYLQQKTLGAKIMGIVLRNVRNTEDLYGGKYECICNPRMWKDFCILH